MDKEPRKRFDWLPAEMPGVVKLMKTRREKDGADHVNECWRRGVLGGEPGWFFAREGPLAVGTPDPAWSWPEFEQLPAGISPALLMMKDSEVKHGAA